MRHNIDRLIERIDELDNPTVVGLDPTLNMMPDALKEAMFAAHGVTPKAVGEMFLSFNKAVIDGVFDLVPAVKPQIAMYEQYGLDGLAAYVGTTGYAASKGLYVIGDAKRGDVASTASAYAARLTGVRLGDKRFDLWREDATTVNPYLGSDGVEPFVSACSETGKAIFVLVKTSNPGSSELQDLVVTDVGSDARSTEETSPFAGEPIYVKVANLVNEWGAGLVGDHNYSSIGAVVGATYGAIGAKLRSLLPRTFFLVPGYGAQGARADALRPFFDAGGRGCIVNSSRGIIAAWQQSKPGEKALTASDSTDQEEALSVVVVAARAATLEMRSVLQSVRGSVLKK
jgi:orotidine-5'-phosphate decarboxylase